MKRISIILTIFILTATALTSQTVPNSSFNFIHQYIQSEKLKDSVKLIISLPEKYTHSKTNYPVVYILDGKWFFPQGVTSQAHFSRFKMTPDLIIIGIENSVKQRSWYVRNSKNFNHFLEKELIPSINKKYRTTNERLLFGWEISGGFVIESLGATPNLFTGYLAASPGPLDKTFMEKYQYRYDAIATLLKSNKNLNSFLYFTTGKSDYPAQYGVDNMLALLKNNTAEGLRWSYKKLSDETHSTTAYKTIQLGIESYFKYYPTLRFSTLEDFISIGGNTYVESYYKKRKEKYHFSEDRNTKDYLNTCKNIVFKAVSEENYEAFNQHINAFLLKDMLSITHYNHASLFAEYYLKNNNTKMATRLMTYYVNKFPDAARPYYILGNVSKQKGDKKKAKKYYLKAIDLGEKNSDRRLSEYKKKLKKL